MMHLSPSIVEISLETSSLTERGQSRGIQMSKNASADIIGAPVIVYSHDNARDMYSRDVRVCDLWPVPVCRLYLEKRGIRGLEIVGTHLVLTSTQSPREKKNYTLVLTHAITPGDGQKSRTTRLQSSSPTCTSSMHFTVMCNSFHCNVRTESERERSPKKHAHREEEGRLEWQDRCLLS